MRVLFLVTVVLMVGLLMTTAEAPRKGRKKNTKGTRRQEHRCAEWVYSSCVPSKGDCGTGLREGTCNGQTKTFKCKVPCNWKKQFSGDCKYQFDSSSGCDSATNTMTLSGTLKKALFNAECRPTIKVSRPCKQKPKPKPKGKTGQLKGN